MDELTIHTNTVCHLGVQAASAGLPKPWRAVFGTYYESSVSVRSRITAVATALISTHMRGRSKHSMRDGWLVFLILERECVQISACLCYRRLRWVLASTSTHPRVAWVLGVFSERS